VSGVVTLPVAVACVEALLKRRGDTDVVVTPDTRIEDLGLDSMDVVDLFGDLEEQAGRALDPESVADIVVVRDLTMLGVQG
jgi:acyl carrier protein